MDETKQVNERHATLVDEPLVSEAYQACLNQARQQSLVMAQRWYSQLAEKLIEVSTSSLNIPEKRQIHEAWAALTPHQAAIEQGFHAALGQTISQAVADVQGIKSTTSAGGGGSGRASQPARSISSLSFDDLELMGDAQVQETLDEARLQQVFLLASESSFAGFSARLSTAQGFKTVRPDKNPLRPDIFASALIHTLKSLSLEAEVRQRWLLYGGQIMGEQLQQLYAQLQDGLAKQGVKPAAYTVKSAPDEPGRTDTLGHATTPPAGRNVFLSREELLTLDHLHRLMSGEYDDAFTDASSAKMGSAHNSDGEATSAASPFMTAALGALQALEKTSAGNAGRRHARPTPPVPVALLREQLKAGSRSLGQSLAVEVVGLMIEQLSTDSRLLAPIQQIIANAEPAFLRMGMSEPRFFSDKNHPARRLLEAITAKSLAFDSEDAAGFAEFMGDLQNVADRLNHEQANSAQHFETLLLAFEAQLANRNAVAAQAQKQAVQALMQAEQRNLLAEKIASEILQRSDFCPGNPSITAFVIGPWAQVMAKERLLGEHGGSRSGKAVYSLALGDVLWSIDFAQASLYRKRLVKIIPDMLNVLRQGLLSIDYPVDQTKDFFNELMRLHEQALTATSAPERLPSKALTRLEDAFTDGDAAINKQPWLDPTEAHQSGFMDFSDDGVKPRFEATVPQALGDTLSPQNGGAEPSFEKTDNLQPGAWVELVANGQWLRAQLTWISPHNTLFMFTSSGGRSHSMTARMLEQLTAVGRFKVISRQGVVVGAFDNVARTAVRNSVQGKPEPQH